MKTSFLYRLVKTIPFFADCKPTLSLLLATILFVSSAIGQDRTAWEGREEQLAASEQIFGSPPDAQRLTPRDRVWVDRKKHRVIADGYVAIQEGQLEMFACPVFTKEHESVVALFSKAATIHAALLAIGAQPGKPVQWEPEYQPPSGSEIRIRALWVTKDGQKKSEDARTWIRKLGAGKKNLETNWVFAGSGFWEDPDTKIRRYLAESGDLICVSNFSTATLDIPVKSTEANAGLLFVADSERVPEPGTPVRLVLQLVKPQPASSAQVNQETSLPTPQSQPQ